MDKLSKWMARSEGGESCDGTLNGTSPENNYWDRPLSRGVYTVPGTAIRCVPAAHSLAATSTTSRCSHYRH